MEASSAGKREYGVKGRCVKYEACLGCWVSPYYGPFSLEVRFETSELFLSLIFNFFSGRSKPRILNRWIRRHASIVMEKIFLTLYNAKRFTSQQE
jgi:hypothetical protein